MTSEASSELSSAPASLRLSVPTILQRESQFDSTETHASEPSTSEPTGYEGLQWGRLRGWRLPVDDRKLRSWIYKQGHGWRLYHEKDRAHYISDNASNTLTGGSGNDTFIFKKFGEDDLTISHTIMDFEEGDSLLFTEFRRNMELEFTQDGNDVAITYNNNMVTVLDAVLAEVESAVDTVRYDYYY